MQWFIYIGIGFIFISGLMVGAWTTGEQQRGNFYSEDKSERAIKRKISTVTLLLGLISFGIAYLIHKF
ncbi:hypothetical protein BK120_34190 [Paenibacillus sp. FSL A5-0031]|uniref:DUF5316 family protein n=1 Tax=Paenibacillus sp. FSL A5-0031 TaxID=1920420 RepID=UPI00096D5061|nr:DUF5316 family protein [Paenibacillus sp. FSL A5-0031]OME67397.1 hypothetical protein BK120_34190 [Paenibacillus sp. FSL A5-0031]